jgi:signal transduction histidine kinase
VLGPDGEVEIIAGTTRDVTERKRAETESREQMRQLSAALQQVGEQEKARIARELHDELGEALAGLKMDLGQIVTALLPEQVELLRRTEAMSALLDRSVLSLRRIAAGMRPSMLDDLGLISTINWLTHDFSQRTGVTVDLELPDSELDIEPDLSIAVFRVLQESLTNIARHAGARRVDVKLSSSGSQIRLQVSDDGNGIAPDRAGTGKRFGLIGMRERAAMLGGELTIDSKPGSGTSICMVVASKPAGSDEPRAI